MSPIALPIAELKSALAGLGKIIAKRVTPPVLGTVRIERTTDGWIALTGTDLDHHVTVRLEQADAGEPRAKEALPIARPSKEIFRARGGRRKEGDPATLPAKMAQRKASR